MKNFLSICIPTFNRANQLSKSLQSITEQGFFVQNKDIEIVVYDNCSIDSTNEVVLQYQSKFPDRIKYFKQNSNVGMSVNFESCLNAANGSYRKLSNDTLLWNQGSVEYVYKLVHSEKDSRPVIFFLNGSINLNSNVVVAHGVDSFISSVSYFSTWIGCFGIWEDELLNNKDFSHYSETDIPHLGSLLNSIERKSNVQIVNIKLFTSLESSWRKRYSLGLVFGKNYMSILRDHSGSISKETLAIEKKKILINHILPYYFNERHDFFLEPLEEHLDDYVSENYYRIAIDTARSKWQRKLRNSELSSVNSLWRLSNPHNQTRLGSQSDVSLIKVGKCSYGAINAYFWGASNEFLKIGSFVSIGDDVKFLTGGNHPYNGLTTFPFKVTYSGYPTEAISKGPIVVGDDVWIGFGAVILSGVTISQGAVIGACAVVASNVPPYAIVVGNPAKVIKYRFSDDLIEKLIKIDLNKLKPENYKNINDLYESLTNDNFENITKKLGLV